MKACLFLIFASLIFSPAVWAQKRFSKSYPANKNVRLQLTNLTGTITVIGWQRDEIRVEARMESSAAKVVPESTNDNLTINIVRDNQGRGDVGSINFEVRVPYNSAVDIETKMGNLTVRDIAGSMIRAKISLEGDINLSNIRAGTVMTESRIGNIFFDGILQPGGTYSFKLTRGDINIHIPFTSSFRLAATASEANNIALGPLANSGLSFASEGRRVTGSVGDGRANMTILNKRGTIAFISR
jgi:DUF4097 and DUF4098 domain-containing protein YvlB